MVLAKPHLRLDPWPAQYDSAIQIESVAIADSGDVDSTLETMDWKEIRPEAEDFYPDLYFVDGVRRVEAWVLTDTDQGIVHGMFGSTAVGCVHCDRRTAVVDGVSVRRLLILGRGLQQSEVIRIGNSEIVFEALSVASNSPVELLGELQNQMRTAEANLAETLVSKGAGVFADGPLTYFSAARQEIVGVIKRIYMPYLSAPKFSLVSLLSSGGRTPVFAIVDGKNDRYSWFQRLAQGREIDHSLAGILRLEVRAAVGLQRTIEIANFSAAHLPRFASSSVREPRAPQNLVPVGALEAELRRRLGDALTIQRAIERRIFEGLTP
jgi:hypothetical protein